MQDSEKTEKSNTVEILSNEKLLFKKHIKDKIKMCIASTVLFFNIAFFSLLHFKVNYCIHVKKYYTVCVYLYLELYLESLDFGDIYIYISSILIYKMITLI